MFVRSILQIWIEQQPNLLTWTVLIPNLRSLILNHNKQVTNDGIFHIANSLIKNDKLAHLSIKDIPLLTDECLQRLYETLKQHNTIMCYIEFDVK